jgi:hypothetical protein
MKHLYPRPLPVILALLFLAGGSVASSRSQALSPADVITAVQAKLAPDTRVAVFDVKAELKDGVVEVTGNVERPDWRDAVLTALRNAGHSTLSDKIALLPDPALGPQHFAAVTVSVATMKTKPSHASELGNQLIMGMPVKVLKREGSWYYTQSLDDRYLGWMEPDHLALMTREGLDAFEAAPRLMVTSLFTIVRELPSADAGAVSDLVMGNILLGGDAKGGWVAAQLPDGRKGYVAADAVAGFEAWKKSRGVTPDNIEKTARLFVGVPYLWGGTSPKGFDCSGFTKTVFRANGFELQRDADQQAGQGEAVSTDGDLARLRKGDLLCFGPRAGVTRITHIGIYLGGKLFIHCAGRVKLNSFDPSSPIYSDSLLKRLVTVRRVPSVTP